MTRIVQLLVGIITVAYLATGTLAASAFEDPTALIEFAYARYDTEGYPDDQADLYSTSLLALIESDAARTPEGEIGALDFDPFVNGQDFAISNLAILEPVIDGDRALVSVTFNNFDTEQMLLFTLVDEGEGWKIDDIESVVPGLEWRLSEILAADPMLN